MSEATLKRKTRTQYNNMSVGSKNGGFSLNGTRRSQGYVGQTMLGRHFPRTPMRGNVARGSGGCCGTYYQGTIIQSGVPFPTGVNGNSANNNPQVVKKSVINNDGHIMTKYRWIRRPQPYSTVKINASSTKNTQGVYINNKSTKLVNSLAQCDELGVCETTSNICGGLSIFQRPRPFGSVIQYPRAWRSITKTANTSNKLGPISQTAFITALHGSCNITEKSFVNVCRAPLPGPPASYR
jgi:hypothetical protein